MRTTLLLLRCLLLFQRHCSLPSPSTSKLFGLDLGGASITVTGGALEITIAVAFRVTPVQHGQAAISLTPPPGFAVVASSFYFAPSIDVGVEAVKVTVTGVSPVGKDLQKTVFLGTEIPLDVPNLVYTITSNDPSRLRVSNSSTQTGSAETTVSSSAARIVYLQALSSSGKVIQPAVAATSCMSRSAIRGMNRIELTGRSWS